VTNNKNIGAKELRGLHLCYSLSQLARTTSTICEMYAVSRVYFLPVHHQLKDSVLRSGNDISIKRSLFDARTHTSV